MLATPVKSSKVPASNSCDIWKEPLWFSSHFILLEFDQISQVWHRVQVRPADVEREQRSREE